VSEALQFTLVIAGVFALNLLPAFGPPTSAVLVAVSLNLDLPEAPLILGGALAAATGRFVLANGARRIRSRLSRERKASLAAAEEMLLAHRGGAVAGLGLFALSPVPSGQLFVAAGLMRVRLLPLTAAFFSGRLVSYTIYVAGATAIEASVGESLTAGLTSPLGIVLQILALAGLAVLLRVDWTRVLARGAGDGPASAHGPGDSGGTPTSDPGRP
jgi:membrane protein YqaA with SNARE-associated domain